MDQKNTVALKVVAGDETRRMRVQDYEDLVNKVLERFPSVVRPVLFTYLDDEEDTVTFNCADEFDEAVHLSESSGKVLKVYVKSGGETNSTNEKSAQEDKKPQGEDEEGFPSHDELIALVKEFVEDGEMKALSREALEVMMASVQEGQSLSEAVDLALEAFPVLAETPLVRRVRPHLDRVLCRIGNWVPTLLAMGPGMVASVLPQLLQCWPKFCGGDNPDVTVDVTEAFEGLFGGPRHPFGPPPPPPCGPAPHGPMHRHHPHGRPHGPPPHGPPQGLPPHGPPAFPPVHPHVQCDGCKMMPIVGPRFKCVECADYDLCDPCRANGVHVEHTLVPVAPRRAFSGPPPEPFRHPFAHHRGRGWGMRGRGRGRGRGGFGLGRFFNDHLNKDDTSPARERSTSSTRSASPSPSPFGGGWCGFGKGRGGRREWKASRPRRPRAKYISDVTLPDHTHVGAGQRLVKTWRMSNTTEGSWPEGTVLVPVRGDKGIVQDAVFPVPEAKAGEEVEVSAVIVTPDQPGRYTVHFRLREPNTPSHNGRLFGPRVWVDIEVVAEDVADALLDEVLEAVAVAVESDREQKQDLMDVAVEPVQSEEVAAVEESEEVAEKSADSSSSEFVQVEQGDATEEVQSDEVEEEKHEVDVDVVEEAADEESVAQEDKQDEEEDESCVEVQIQEEEDTSAQFAFQRGQLYGMGFTNDEENIALLKQFNGDVTAVVNLLLSRV